MFEPVGGGSTMPDRERMEMATLALSISYGKTEGDRIPLASWLPECIGARGLAGQRIPSRQAFADSSE